MIQGLFSVAEVNAMIEKGDTLLLAGDAKLLSQLKKGKWIGGSTSRFIESGKKPILERTRIFVHNISDFAVETKLMIYDESNIANIYDDAFDNGFSVLIVAPFSPVINEYTDKCSNYSNFSCRAVCGWGVVASIYSEYEKNDESIVFCGQNATSYTNEGVVMHIGLAPDKFAEIHAFSPYKPDEDGDIITFDENKQQVEYAFINGIKQNFRQYLIDNKIDRTHDASILSRKCLAGNHGGIFMNVGIMSETEKDAKKFVSFTSSVYKGINYGLANMENFDHEILTKKIHGEIVFSLTCVNYFANPDIFEKFLTKMNGPFTYGELAYFPMSNATVYVSIGNILN
ncbi:MAG: hypothetical protein FWH18_01765 [Marinilabiliaceae bacterium]|nr:hypothetical protein [Marinilabiliaceae bacterium]